MDINASARVVLHEACLQKKKVSRFTYWNGTSKVEQGIWYGNLQGSRKASWYRIYLPSPARATDGTDEIAPS